MIVLVPIILLAFSVVWFLVWFWFFKPEMPRTENYYKLALKAFEVGDYKTAKELFLKIPNLNSNVEARYKLGICHLKLREFGDAQGCFEFAIKKSPKNIDALSNLGDCYDWQEKYDDAIDIYNRLVKADGNNLDNYLNIAKIYNKKGDPSKALETLEKVRKKFSNNSKYMLAIINCKSKMCDKKDVEECKKILEQYKELEKRNDLPPEFYISIAKAYAMNGELDNAFENCQKAVELTSDDVEVYQLLGLIQLLKHDVESAKSNLTVALNFQPSNKDTHNIFSYVLCQSVDSCTLSKCRENYYKLVSKYLK